MRLRGVKPIAFSTACKSAASQTMVRFELQPGDKRLHVHAEDQEELDRYYEAVSAGVVFSMRVTKEIKFPAPAPVTVPVDVPIPAEAGQPEPVPQQAPRSKKQPKAAEPKSFDKKKRLRIDRYKEFIRQQPEYKHSLGDIINAIEGGDIPSRLNKKTNPAYTACADAAREAREEIMDEEGISLLPSKVGGRGAEYKIV